MSRRVKRDKRVKGKKREDLDSPDAALTPENLGNAASPFKRIFPWDFPGQNGDWVKKDPRK
jgi:hypothetical protein